MADGEPTRYFAITRGTPEPTGLFRMRQPPDAIIFERYSLRTLTWNKDDDVSRYLIVGDVDVDEVDEREADAIVDFFQRRFGTDDG